MVRSNLVSQIDIYSIQYISTEMDDTSIEYQKTYILPDLQYQLINSQNKQIDNTIQQIQDQLQYYENNSNFQNHYANTMFGYNYYLFLFYYIMVFVLILVFLMYPSKYTIWTKSLIVLGFLLFPWFSLSLKEWLFNTFYYWSAVIQAKPYLKPTQVHPGITTPIFPLFG